MKDTLAFFRERVKEDAYLDLRTGETILVQHDNIHHFALGQSSLLNDNSTFWAVTSPYEGLLYFSLKDKGLPAQKRQCSQSGPYEPFPEEGPPLVSSTCLFIYRNDLVKEPT